MDTRCELTREIHGSQRSRHAAIDVGSNSIRLLVADVDAAGDPHRVHTDREVVRLGTGVFRDGRLTAQAMQVAYRVLERMAEATRGHGVLSLRAVGTSALREASNSAEFVLRASTILDAPLEVVDGVEEARLVQRGVTAQWPHPDERVLIVDVGGGSVQLMLSDCDHFVAAASMPLGAVRLTEMFARCDPMSDVDVTRMRHHIRRHLWACVHRFKGARVDRLIATSATAGAIVSAVNGIRRSDRHEADRRAATARQVGDLFINLCQRDVADRARITGVGRRRAEVVVAGVAVLDEIMALFGNPVLHYSAAGVRDGIIADLALEQLLAAGLPRLASTAR